MLLGDDAFKPIAHIFGIPMNFEKLKEVYLLYTLENCKGNRHNRSKPNKSLVAQNSKHHGEWLNYFSSASMMTSLHKGYNYFSLI